ncbi:ribosomal RNA small subunit methyltransferase A [Candidatus Parcubacteria bacterium]|nr:ribosomal RNA small subunit methyltransferase A [Candidatus Parcubacteria bacterium]
MLNNFRSMLQQETKTALKKYNISLKHKFGQNFLTDAKILDKIIKTADLKKEDAILEIGAGVGTLTRELAKKVKKIIAVEIDRGLVKILRKIFNKTDNVEIIEKNILSSEFKVENFKDIKNSYKIVANLPYNITSRFIRKFLSDEKIRPQEMVLMVQKEVAERITAKQGQMSLLSVSCQFYADCELAFFVSRKSFLPIPKVDSAVVKLKIKDCRLKIDEKYFFQIVKAGFSSRRKKLKSNLAKGLDIKKEDIDKIFIKLKFGENIRAQELSVEYWIGLYKNIKIIKK